MLVRRLIISGIVVALLGVGDVAAREFAEGRIESEVELRVPGSFANASIRAMPFMFLGRLLVTGKVDLDVDGEIVAGEGTPGLGFGVEMRGLKLDRAKLVTGKVRAQGLGSGGAEMSIEQKELERLLTRKIILRPGRAAIVELGREVPVALAATSSSISITGDLPAGGGDIQIGLRLGRDDLLPCTPKVTIETGRIVIHCRFTRPPRALTGGF